jgi:hypothetical protein
LKGWARGGQLCEPARLDEFRRQINGLTGHYVAPA